MKLICTKTCEGLKPTSGDDMVRVFWIEGEEYEVTLPEAISMIDGRGDCFQAADDATIALFAAFVDEADKG